MTLGAVPTTPVTTKRAGITAATGAMFALLLIGYTVNAMDRQVFPTLLVAVRQDLGFGAAQSGLQSTIFSLGIGLLGIPTGYLMTRLRRKPVVVVGTLLFSAATALTCVSVGFWDMLLWRVLSGVGESLQFTALITIAAVAFPARRGMAIGTINLCFALGALIGPAIGGKILDATGQWRIPEIAFAILGGVIAVLIAIFVKPTLTDRREGAVQSDTVVLGGAPTYWNRNLGILVVMTVLGGLVDFGFLGLYSSFLQTVHDYSAGAAGVVTGVSGAGALLSFYGGHLGDRFPARIVLPVSYIVTAGAGAAVFLGPSNFAWQLVFALVFGLAFSAGSFVLLAGFIVKSVDSQRSAAASGIFVTSLYIPAAFAGLLLSSLAQAMGWGAAASLQIVLGAVIAAVLGLFLRQSEFSRVQPRLESDDVRAEAFPAA
jgi:MFS family permease